jgi:hypothetical protein
MVNDFFLFEIEEIAYNIPFPSFFFKLKEKDSKGLDHLKNLFLTDSKIPRTHPKKTIIDNLIQEELLSEFKGNIVKCETRINLFMADRYRHPINGHIFYISQKKYIDWELTTTTFKHKGETTFAPKSHFNVHLRQGYFPIKKFEQLIQEKGEYKESQVVPKYRYEIVEQTIFEQVCILCKPHLITESPNVHNNYTEILDLNKIIHSSYAKDNPTDKLGQLIDDKIPFFIPASMKPLFYNFLVIQDGQLTPKHYDIAIGQLIEMLKEYLDDYRRIPIETKSAKALLELIINIPTNSSTNSLDYPWYGDLLINAFRDAKLQQITLEQAIFQKTSMEVFFSICYNKNLSLEFLNFKALLSFADFKLLFEYFMEHSTDVQKHAMHNFFNKHVLVEAISNLIYSVKIIKENPNNAGDLFVGKNIEEFERKAIQYVQEELLPELRNQHKEQEYSIQSSALVPYNKKTEVCEIIDKSYKKAKIRLMENTIKEPTIEEEEALGLMQREKETNNFKLELLKIDNSSE